MKILTFPFLMFITNLNFPPYTDPFINTENVEDTVLKAKMKFLNHRSIKTLRDWFPNNSFLFNKI